MIQRVYIAAPYSMKAQACLLRDQLGAADIMTTSRWLDMQRDTTRETAEMDLQDIDGADAVVFLNPEAWAEKGSGGRHVEVGYAMALGMPVVILGVPTNVFHSLRLVQIFDKLDDVVRWLHAAESSMNMNLRAMINFLMARVHLANRKWWHDITTDAPLQRNVGELLMLTVSELAEAMEGHRKNLPDDKLPAFPMMTVEIADALIRLFDIGGGLQLALGEAFAAKMAYNAVREDHTHAHRLTEHGKKY